MNQTTSPNLDLELADEWLKEWGKAAAKIQSIGYRRYSVYCQKTVSLHRQDVQDISDDEMLERDQLIARSLPRRPIFKQVLCVYYVSDQTLRDTAIITKISLFRCRCIIEQIQSIVAKLFLAYK